MEGYPLTPERWSDFEALFGKYGAYGGCWCMWWRVTRRQMEEEHGEGNRRAMKAIVESGEIPGLLYYQDGRAVAWCSVAPREHFASLNRSPVLKRLDDRPVWSIVCFYVARANRGQGLMVSLIQEAVEYVRRQGGAVVEAYPTVPRGGDLHPASSFMGLPAAFEQAGFVACAQPSKSKMIMRYYLEKTE